MSFSYTKEQGFANTAQQALHEFGGEYRLKKIPKLYVLSIAGVDPVICDYRSIESVLLDFYGGKCVNRKTLSNGVIEIEWQDSIDDLLDVNAIPSPAYLFNMEAA